MRVVVGDGAGELADLELRVADEDATVGDLLDALGHDDGATGVVIDGRFCHADLALSEIGIYEGARLRAVGGPPSEHPRASEGLELRVVAGLDAGRRMPLGSASVTVGRDDDCDLVLLDDGVSRRHAQVAPSVSGLRATVTDLGSINGTWVEGKRIERETEVSPGVLFEAGDVALEVTPVTPGMAIDPLRQARRDGTIPFNRPPRARAPESGGPLSAPERPPDPERPRLSVVSAVGPLVLGLVLVIALHNILFALFMLLSPILVVGSWLENRRFARRTAQGHTREQAQQLARFRELVAERHAAELAGLRATLPDPSEVVRRATAPDPRLWERRPDHEDFLWLMGGLGRVPFRPPLTQRMAPALQAEEILAEYAELELAPVRIDLSAGGVVGLVGPREHALALARSLVCQAAVLHGPADLRIAVLTEASGRDAWDWAKWFPHARDASSGGSRRLLAAGSAAAGALAGELADPDRGDARRTLVVLDSPALIEGRGAPGRALLRRAELISGIVLAGSVDRLPASCTTVVELSAEGAEAVLRRPQAGELTDPLLVAGVSGATARECALALARFEDADLELTSGALPEYVELLGLLGLRDLDADVVRSSWAHSSLESGLRATFALGQDGPFGLDLVADGPHGLIAGTTGAGKSELLRSLVAALAAAHGPDRLNFVLIDYKGGSAFAQCAELPHTVGLVTDLDEQLGERALQSLEAELRYRERILRERGVGDLIEYGRLIAAGRAEPLPRLLVIIDEFATLAAELPDFIASLVGIAQRGRSLGVHLLLATQRPSGAVSENIRANTNVRICLRVNTPQESNDVIDAPAAAQIGRNQPGRAQVRLGPSELVPIQTALVSTVAASGPGGALELRPFCFPAPEEPSANGSDAERRDADGASASQLERLVAATREAFADRAAPRRPWLPPLPASVELSDLLAFGPPRPLGGESGFVVPLGLADDPPAQAQYPVGWNLDAGNLLMFGIGGSGTTTALTTLAAALAELGDAARVHVYVVDFGAGELAPLERLANVGAVITAGEHERQRRLLRRLHDELRVRRGLDAGARAALPRIVLLLDGYAGFTAEHAEGAGESAREELARVWADGSELGVHVAITADRLGAVPLALSSLAQQRLAFQLAELADYAQFGISRRAVPRFSPGRAIAAGRAQVLQVAKPGSALARLLAGAGREAGAAGGRPAPIGVLPDRVPLEALLEAKPSDREPWFVPVALGDDALAPVGFELFEGDHALVTGRPRAGKTTALLVAAAVVARMYPDVQLVGVALRRSALRDGSALARLATTPDELDAILEELRGSGGATVPPSGAADHPTPIKLLLIDDAETIDDPRRVLADLLSAPGTGVHALIAGRAETFRALGHWSTVARRSRTGLLLAPDLQMDGALLGATLPRRPAPPARPGCGYLVRPADFELVQVATVSAGAAG